MQHLEGTKVRLSGARRESDLSTIFTLSCSAGCCMMHDKQMGTESGSAEVLYIGCLMAKP